MKRYKIDYLSFTIPDVKRDDYLSLLDVKLDFLNKGFRGYKESASLSKGGMFGCTLGRIDSHFDISGKYIGNYISDYVGLVKLIEKIYADGGNVSRIDYALDVVEELDYTTILKSVRRGELVSKSRCIKIIEKAENTADGLVMNGGTIYVGSPSSHKMLRIYDKTKESKLTEKVVRLEVQLRDKAALSSLRQLIRLNEDSVCKYIQGLILGTVDFRKNDGGNITRRKRVLWYGKLMECVEVVKLVFEKFERTITKVVEWVDKQVAPSLALIRKYYGIRYGSILRYLVESGEQRLTERQLAVLRL